MKTFYINNQNRKSFLNQMNNSVTALGFFDGVHLGHQKVIQTAVTIAKQKNLQPAVMTFTPHPKEVLGKEKVDYLTSLDTKKERFEELGVEVLYLVNFDTDFAALSPKEFVQNYIIDFKIKHVVAGYDFTYGFRGEGNMQRIVLDGQEQYEATTISKIHFEKEKVSSTRIRALIQSGNVDVLPHLLGNYYCTTGTINQRSLFNNGNIVYEVTPYASCLLPIPGTYEVEVESDGESFRAIIHRYTLSDDVIFMTPPRPNLLLKAGQSLKISWIKCWSIKKKLPSVKAI